MELTKVQKDIAAILIQCALHKDTIAFSEFKALTGTGKRQVGDEVGPISHKCKEFNLPLLSALVVYKETNKTGDGFIDEFYKGIIPRTEEAYRICEENIQAVWACQDWSKLINYIKSGFEFTLEVNDTIKEGDLKEGSGNYRTRSGLLRNDCIAKKGTKCCICGFDAAQVYGEQFAGKIHVHHSIMLNQGERDSVVEDLFPVCPNCHMILHSKGKKEVFDIEEVRKFYNRNK